MKDVLERKRTEYLIKKGKRNVFDGFVLIYEKKKDRDSKYAVIVSKKVSHSSVSRNKIKRMSREIIRKNRPPSFDVIIFFTKKIEPIKDMQNVLQHSLQTLQTDGTIN